MMDAKPTPIEVESRRWGTVELPADAALELVEPLLGFPGLTRFVVFRPEPETPLLWLQARDNPDVGFLLVDPTSIADRFGLPRKVLAGSGLEITGPAETLLLAIVTLRSPWVESTANLRAPLIVNTRTRRARQVVLEQGGLGTREPLFRELPAASGGTP